MKFINDQYEKYLQEEININRKKRIPDTRVHCCIYFIPATGHSYVHTMGSSPSMLPSVPLIPHLNCLGQPIPKDGALLKCLEELRVFHEHLELL